MRTFIYKKLKSVSDWLRLWMVGGRKVLSAKEAAIYLKTSVGYIYQLKSDYSLPYYKTNHNHLYFKKKEIDAWLRSRHCIDFRVPSIKEKKSFGLTKKD